MLPQDVGNSVRLADSGGVTTITADDPRLEQGWWVTERRDGRSRRWTNGAGSLPLDRAGPARIEVLGVLPAVYALPEAPEAG